MMDTSSFLLPLLVVLILINDTKESESVRNNNTGNKTKSINRTAEAESSEYGDSTNTEQSNHHISAEPTTYPPGPWKWKWKRLLWIGVPFLVTVLINGIFIGYCCTKCHKSKRDKSHNRKANPTPDDATESGHLEQAQNDHSSYTYINLEELANQPTADRNQTTGQLDMEPLGDDLDLVDNVTYARCQKEEKKNAEDNRNPPEVTVVVDNDQLRSLPPTPDDGNTSSDQHRSHQRPESHMVIVNSGSDVDKQGVCKENEPERASDLQVGCTLANDLAYTNPIYDLQQNF